MDSQAFFENIRTGLLEIWGHKLRSALTLTGIILGVLSINSMFSLIGGIRTGIEKGFQSVGMDKAIFLSPRPVNRDDSPISPSASRGLTMADVDAINAANLGATASPITNFQKELVGYDGKKFKAQFSGVNGTFLRMRQLRIATGRAITVADEASMAPVAIVGEKIARTLFGRKDVLEERLVLPETQLTIVGVLETVTLPPGVHMGGLDTEGNTIYIPATTAVYQFQGPRNPIGVAIEIHDVLKSSEVAGNVRALISHRHRGVPDFEVSNVAEELLRARDEIGEMLSNWNIVLGCIAGVALLVGGIGILSVMLIAVQERLFEIGLRKSLGARDEQILLQFMVEAVVLSAVGAAIGSGLALLFVQFLSSKFPTGLSLAPSGLVLSYSFAMVTGLVFGIYPAWLASRMSPVEALRAA